MISYVYVIQNILNNKIYVGKSNNPQDRWKTHKKVSLGGKIKYPRDFFSIHGSLAKYGCNHFTFQIIEEFNNEEECLNAEQFWIQFFRSWDRDFGYNLSLGGDGVAPTIETKNKMSKAQQGEKHSQAILTEILVMEIYHKYKTGDYTQRQLAQEYHVNYGSINDIIKNRTWKHLKRTTLSKPHSVEQSKKLFVRNGKSSGNSKITENQVMKGILLYKTGNYTFKKIGEILGVKTHTIRAAIVGTNWKHIDRGLNANQ